MSILITSDTHFTDKPVDEYRWQLFEFLIQCIEKHKVAHIIIAGDISDVKDRHSAVFVNRLTKNLVDLSALVKSVILLRGNHDGLIPDLPFFKFVSHIPKIQFVTVPSIIDLEGYNGLFLPNTQDPVAEWKNVDFRGHDYIFMHQTFNGAISESGQKLEGIDHHWLSKADKDTIILSGDIHKSQHIKNLEYIGSPFFIHFGDNITPRVMLLEGKKVTSIPTNFIKKHTIKISSVEELNQYKLDPKDQVKLRIIVNDILEWEQLKNEIIEACKKKEVDVHQIELIQTQQVGVKSVESQIKTFSPQELLSMFCKENTISDEVADYGKEILNASTNK